MIVAPGNLAFPLSEGADDKISFFKLVILCPYIEDIGQTG